MPEIQMRLVGLHFRIDAGQTAKKGHRPKPTPLGNLGKEKGVLHLLFFAHFGRSIPGALGCYAIGLVLCF
jgi:hypothetical protein